MAVVKKTAKPADHRFSIDCGRTSGNIGNIIAATYEEHIKQMNGEDYLIYKRKLLFRFFDTNGNNLLELDDFLRCPRRFRNVCDSGPDIVTALFEEYWNKLANILKVPISQAVTMEQWLTGVVQMQNSDWYRELFLPTMSTGLFDSVDSNHDGRITFEEWKTFQNQRGVTEEEVIKSTFSKLDIDNDGIVTRAEVSNAFYQFGNGRDPKNDYSFIYKIK